MGLCSCENITYTENGTVNAYCFIDLICFYIYTYFKYVCMNSEWVLCICLNIMG